MATLQEQTERERRFLLGVGSLCSVYSRSNETWSDGKIAKIFIQHETNQEWFIVKYGNNKSKKMQRFCEDLKFRENNNYCDNLIISHIHSSVSYYVLEKTASNLLIFGYIRFTHIHIPKELVKLFMQFYYESMPSFYISGSGKINYNQCEIFRDFDKNIEKDKTYCISQIGWASGIHEFKIKLIELPNGSTGIGVATDKKGFVKFKSSLYLLSSNWAFDSKDSGITYQIYYDNSNRYQNWFYDGIYVHDTGTEIINHKLRIKWNKNDIIGFIINCNQWTITFYINNEKVGNTLHLTSNIKYYPAIAFGGNSDAKFQCIEC